MLSRDAILGANDLEVRDVDVPEWGGTVRLKALSGAERDSWENSIRALRGEKMIPNPVNARAKLVAKAIVDEKGERLFKDSEAAALGAKAGVVLDRLFDIVAEMSGLADGDTEEAGKDSEPDPSDASTSDSPETSDAPSENS